MGSCTEQCSCTRVPGYRMTAWAMNILLISYSPDLQDARPRGGPRHGWSARPASATSNASLVLDYGVDNSTAWLDGVVLEDVSP